MRGEETMPDGNRRRPRQPQTGKPSSATIRIPQWLRRELDRKLPDDADRPALWTEVEANLSLYANRALLESAQYSLKQAIAKQIEQSIRGLRDAADRLPGNRDDERRAIEAVDQKLRPQGLHFNPLERLLARLVTAWLVHGKGKFANSTGQLAQFLSGVTDYLPREEDQITEDRARRFLERFDHLVIRRKGETLSGVTTFGADAQVNKNTAKKPG
jgi:ABC-type transporter Mla subunit MlaD